MKKTKSSSSVPTHRAKVRKKRPGVHSKSKTSKIKSSKNYKKKIEDKVNKKWDLVSLFIFY